MPSCQGKDAWMQRLCSSANMSQWARQGEPWEPLFLDQDLQRMSLQIGSASPTSSTSCVQAAPQVVTTPKQDLSPKPQQISPKKSTLIMTKTGTVLVKELADTLNLCVQKIEPGVEASPSMRADAPIFVPGGL
eukprot:TRINITY_DN101192_c0_g1_i1.p1 TRINITY_DN101192_c0_g1~~TRINITY_DN101192_c0_g1_i1.p1  ORF type:complete len:133 (+),score=29.07 TRINITY_DN101192_c0_g1_i1:143-541(+)